MIKEVKLASDYLQHVATSMNEHGAHSPFLFELLKDCIYNKYDDPVFNKIESIRSTLRKDNTMLNVTDLGQGSTYDGLSSQRSVSFITRKFSKPPRLGRLLYRLTHHFKPASMLELGTSMGITAMYQAAGNKDGSLTTVEGCPATYTQALKNIGRSGISNIHAVNASFDDYIPAYIREHGHPQWAYVDGNHNYRSTVGYFEMLRNEDDQNQVLVFDDINWSDEMKKAWKYICEHERTTMTINLFFIGIVLFRKELSAQNFRVRFL